MTEPFTIAIVGLGTTGVSLGLALKKASKTLRIVGHDREPEAAARARKLGAVDSTDWNLPNACRSASIVILALPLGAIRDTMAAIAPELPAGCLVTDTAPLKVPVMAWAEELLPAGVSFVGGNPIGARGRPGEPAADRFLNTTYCLCVSRAARAEAVDSASDLAEAVGARPHFVDPEEHDGLVALLDQAPIALAAALLRTACSQGAWQEMVRLGSGRFEQLFRIIGEEPGSGLQAAAANLPNVSRWLDWADEALRTLRQQLEAADEKDRDQLVADLTDARLEWQRRGEEEKKPLPNVGFSLRRTLGLREP